MRAHLETFTLSVAVILALNTPGIAQEDAEDRPETWQELALQSGASKADLDRLARDRFVVSNRRFKAIFEPYIDGGLPVFITTDSILRGFHVLLEETLSRVEMQRARELEWFLETAWKELQSAGTQVTGDNGLLDQGRTRARIVRASCSELPSG